MADADTFRSMSTAALRCEIQRREDAAGYFNAAECPQWTRETTAREHNAALLNLARAEMDKRRALVNRA